MNHSPTHDDASPQAAIDVIGLGELLWDCFPDERRPGGAPANVAFHAQQLGLNSAVATRVGTDSLGDELLDFLTNQGLSTALVQRDAQHGTGTVTVEPRASHTDYTFLENSAWDYLEVTPSWEQTFRQCRAVGFGTLAQRNEVSRRTIQACLRQTTPDCLILYDVNLRPPFYSEAWIEESLQLANMVKLNSDEVIVLAGMFQLPPDDWSVASWLRETYQLRLVCVTRGSEGALAVTETEHCEVPGLSVTVADTVGAGDAFTAAMIFSELNRWPLRKSLTLANRIGGLVASRAGAMPALKTEFAACIQAVEALA